MFSIADGGYSDGMIEVSAKVSHLDELIRGKLSVPRKRDKSWKVFWCGLEEIARVHVNSPAMQWT